MTPFYENHGKGYQHDKGDNQYGRQRVHGARANQLEQAANGAWQTGGDTGKDNHGNAISQAPFSYLLAQPHQKHRAGNQRRYGHKTKHQPRIHDQPRLCFQCDGDSKRLKKCQEHGRVTRVLRNLSPPRFAFLLERLEGRVNHRHELHDDRGRDIGHDPERKNRKA